MAESKKFINEPDFFDYNRDLFILTRQSVLNSAMNIATANSTLKGLSAPDSSSLALLDYNTDSAAFLGVSTFNDTFDYKSVAEAKKSLKSANEYIAGLNEQMYNMVDVISEIDPDIKGLIKKLEVEVLKGYTNLGLAGLAVDAVQLYSLFEKNIDGILSNLTEDEKAFLDIIKEKADYANMSFGEKLDQSVSVFLGSAIEGIVQVGEYVFDGSVILCANIAASSANFTPETKKLILEKAYDITDVKVAESFYDLYVEGNDLNKYIAEGAVHQIGFAAGKVGGEALLTMIPGGKAVEAYVKVASAVGKQADSRNTNLDIETSNAYALSSGVVSAGFSLVAGAKSDKIKDLIKQDPGGFVSSTSKDMWELRGIRFAGSLANSAMRYANTGGEKSLGEFVKEDAGVVVPEIIGSTIGDELKMTREVNKALKKDNSDLYNITKGVMDAKENTEKFGVDKAIAEEINNGDIDYVVHDEASGIKSSGNSSSIYKDYVSVKQIGKAIIPPNRGELSDPFNGHVEGNLNK